MSTGRLLIALFLLMTLVLPTCAPAAAQEASPRAADGSWLPSFVRHAVRPAPAVSVQAPGAPLPQAIQADDGLWRMPADAVEWLLDADRPVAAPQSSGGPDDFGYTFDAAPLSWIDASGGSSTGISASVDGAGPFDIGFPFKYYENGYDQLWVSRHGFLAFNDRYLSRSQSPMPDLNLPNDVIAPHWIPTYDSPDYVRYLRGGTAPNRWFVMEWSKQRSDESEFTFQAVLLENGDLVFQYRAMDYDVSGISFCMASGIEDSTGFDGLAITDFCQRIASNQAVRITRPAPTARLRISPQHDSAFIYPGQISSTEITIRNIGELGADTYDLDLNISWAAGLFHADGVTPLTDTNSNGLLDTGPVAQGQAKTVIIKVWSSASALIGHQSTATLTARSSRDPSKQRSAVSRIAVPAPFTQVYRDDADGAMSMMLVQPQAQAARQATPDGHRGENVTITELPNHNQLYLWNTNRCLDAICSPVVTEIEYTILDPYGETVRPVARLIDHSGAAFATYDYLAGVAVAPDGRVGVLWYRRLVNLSNGESNFNIYWAALDVNGNLVTGPKNVTNNTVWGSGTDFNAPSFYNPGIAATGDYRFVLAWEREQWDGERWVSDVWYAVLTHTGDVVFDPTRLTNNTAGGERTFNTPALAQLSDNRALLMLSQYENEPSVRDIAYAVLGSDGTVQRALTQLTNGPWEYGPDAIQLADGRTVIAWTGEPQRNLGEQGWTGQYFNNETLSGTPALTRTDAHINFNWDLESPGEEINPDFFSVRWQGAISVSEGRYRFTMGSDDGSRLWIDDVLVLDRWDTCCQYWNKEVNLSAGNHSVRMEMHEHDGAAWAYLSWRDTASPVIKFAVLDDSFNKVAGPTVLSNPAALLGNSYVSVTSGAANLAVLTWMDGNYYYRRNLYYALVDANGVVLTPAVAFQTSQATAPTIFSSYQGYGNTTYTWTPPVGVDSELSATPAVGYALPGGAASPIQIKLTGRGRLPATSVRLSATLDPRLSYVNDTSGVTPTVSGQTVVWNLPDLRLFDTPQFHLNVQAASGNLGEMLSVQLRMTSAETDLTPGNNNATIQVRLSKPVYLPLLTRR